MNPEPLRATAINSGSRELLCIEVDDETDDEIFAKLLGDQVDPRRDIIANTAVPIAMSYRRS